jgi:hypothetical protein
VNSSIGASVTEEYSVSAYSLQSLRVYTAPKAKRTTSVKDIFSLCEDACSESPSKVYASHWISHTPLGPSFLIENLQVCNDIPQ